MLLLANRILQILKKDPQYRLDSSLRILDLVEIFWKMGMAGLRGLCLRCWFKSVRGLCFIHPGAIVRNPHYIVLGRNVVLEEGCEVQGASQQGISLGDQVTVGRLAMIRPSGYYGRELGEGLQVGAHSNIGAYCYIGCAGFIQIGENVLMGPRVGLFAENHVFSDPLRLIREQGVERKGIVIEDNCWLGTACTILDGVRIGQGSVVAAGSVVTHDVPPMSVVAGVPAKVIKSRS